MKTLKTIVIAAISLFFLSASCEKQDPEPVFTQGFSCQIDGVEWVAKTPASIGGPVALHADFEGEGVYLILNAARKDNDENIYDNGTYMLRTFDGNGEARVGFADIENIGSCAAFYHDSIAPGIVKICNFNKTERQITGTFEMDLIAYQCNNEIMKITDGKFSFKY